MSYKEVLVTGGSGFIGSFLVTKLLERGYIVKVFDLIPLSLARNLTKVCNHENFFYYEGDITQIENLRDIVTPNLSSIYHLSSVVGVGKYISNPLNVIDVNVIGTRNILDLAQEHGIKVIYTSTSEIYGKNPKVPWSEKDDRVLGPTSVDRWSYSSSKAVAEHLVLSFHKHSKLPVSIVRYFNIYGPRQNPILVVPQTIKKILLDEKPLLYDTGNQTRCFTFVEDAIEATIQVALSDKTDGEIYNIGSDIEISIYELISKIFKLFNKEMIYEDFDTNKYYGTNYQDIDRRVPDVKKIKDAIGWSISTNLDVGLKKTIEWAKKNEWWLK